MTGLMVVERSAAIQLVNVAVAVLSAFLGVWLSFSYDFPTTEADHDLQFGLYSILLTIKGGAQGKGKLGAARPGIDPFPSPPLDTKTGNREANHFMRRKEGFPPGQMTGI